MNSVLCQIIEFYKYSRVHGKHSHSHAQNGAYMSPTAHEFFIYLDI